MELKNEGNEYFKQGDYDKALRCYGKAVEITPDYRDAWNNKYLTLLKQERTEEAGKCKEILDKLTQDPQQQPKSVGSKQFTLLQKVFIVIITILLVIAVVVATEALMGIGSKRSGQAPIDTTMTSLVALSPVSLNLADNNSSGPGIPSSVGMVSDSFNAVQESLVAISPIGLDLTPRNSSGTNSTHPS